MAATKLYLLNTNLISNPAGLDSATKSSALPIGTNKGGTGGSALDLGATKGGTGNEVSDTYTTGTAAVQTSGVIRKWVSAVLGGANIAAQNWTVGMSVAENNAAANYFLCLSIYVLKSDGTVRGYIYDSSTALGAEFPTSSTGRVVTVAGAAVTGVTNTDQLVVEVWGQGIQTGTTSRTITWKWNGGTDPTDGVGTSDCASYIAAATQDIFASGGTAWSQPLSDSVTITEATAKTPTLNKTDSVTTSEATAKTPTLNKSDSVTTSETHTAAPKLNKSDSVTMSDANAKTVGKGLSDSVTATEAHAATLSKVLADSVASSDAVANTLTKNLTDSVTVVDSTTKAISLVKGETISVADAVAKMMGVSKADTAGITDAIAKALTKSISDSVTISDDLQPTHGHALQLGDSVGASDTVVKNITKGLSDAVSAADIVAKTFAHFIADSVGATDVEAAHLVKLLQDDVDVDEAVAKSMAKYLTDSTSVTDLIEYAFPLFYTLADVVVVSDQIRIYVNGQKVAWYRRDPDTYEVDAAGPWFDRNLQSQVESANADWYTKNQRNS